MATKKATTKKSTSSRATAAKKTTVKASSRKLEAPRASAAAKVSGLSTVKASRMFPANLPNIILAELVGTFILTLVALNASSLQPLFVGFTLAVIALAMGAISGAHVNPAVTFGLWTMRKLKTVMVPVYWLSQVLGALLAIGVLNVITSGQFSLNLSSFASFNFPLMMVELLGMAAFMFGVAAVVGRKELSAGSRAFGVGFALLVGLVVASTLLYQQQTADYAKYQKDSAKVTSETDKPAFPRSLTVKGPALNPAVALAVGEDDSARAQVTGEPAPEGKKQSSRFGLEVIVGTLVGAAIGGNLYLLVAYRPKDEQ